MSVHVSSWVWKHSQSRATDRLVLLAIADHADDRGGSAYPSVSHLAEKCAVNRATVMRSIERLEELGELVVVRRPGSGSTYRIVMQPPVAGCDQSDDPEPPDDPSQSATGDNLRPVAQSDRTGRNLRPHRSQSATRNHQEPSTTEKSDPEIDRLCEVLADAVEIHGKVGRPKITSAWHNDMRLLIERGPTDLAAPERIDPERIERAIDVLFGRLASPDKPGGFCWADQVRSPGALRKHWTRIRATAQGQNRQVRDETPEWA